MRVAVVGGRDFNDKNLLYETLSKYDISSIVSGGANGADSLAESYAKDNGIGVTVYFPDWKKHGRAAGPIRNKQIVSDCETVIAFWDGISRGTKSSITEAKRLNKKVIIIYYGRNDIIQRLLD